MSHQAQWSEEIAKGSGTGLGNSIFFTGRGVYRVGQAAQAQVQTPGSSPSTPGAGTSTSIPQFPAKAISSRQMMRPPSLTSWPEQRRRSGGRRKMLSSLRAQTWRACTSFCRAGHVGEGGHTPRTRGQGDGALLPTPLTCSAGECLPCVSHVHHLPQGLTHLSAAPG